MIPSALPRSQTAIAADENACAGVVAQRPRLVRAAEKRGRGSSVAARRAVVNIEEVDTAAAVAAAVAAAAVAADEGDEGDGGYVAAHTKRK